MTTGAVEHSVAISASLTLDHVSLLDKLAQKLQPLRPNRSAAIAYVLDLHAEVDIERLEDELDARPYAVTEWSPPALDEKLIGYVAGLVRAGNSVTTALHMAGVTAKQWKKWETAGKQDLDRQNLTLEADLVHALRRAEAECKVEDMRRIRAHGMKNFRALTWRLERLYPGEFGERKTIDGTISHQLTPMVDWDKLTLPEARTLVGLLEKASPDPEDKRLSRTARPAAELIPGDVAAVIEQT